MILSRSKFEIWLDNQIFSSRTDCNIFCEIHLKYTCVFPNYMTLMETADTEKHVSNYVLIIHSLWLWSSDNVCKYRNL